MPHKSFSEIRHICQKHTNLAIGKWLNDKDKHSDIMRNWLNILKNLNSNGAGPVYDIIPRVLKYIALYEKRASQSYINFRECYLYLSDISNGLASKNLDEASQYFLFQRLIKLAESIKNSEIKPYTKHLDSLKNFDELQKNFTASKKQNVLNPLGVPKSLLKFTELDKEIDVVEDTPLKTQKNLKYGLLHIKTKPT